MADYQRQKRTVTLELGRFKPAVATTINFTKQADGSHKTEHFSGTYTFILEFILDDWQTTRTDHLPLNFVHGP